MTYITNFDGIKTKHIDFANALKATFKYAMPILGFKPFNTISVETESGVKIFEVDCEGNEYVGGISVQYSFRYGLKIYSSKYRKFLIDEWFNKNKGC